MGTWGGGAFENDGAMDWFAQLELEGLNAARAAVQAVLDQADDYLDASVCEEGLAAAEILAAVRGRPAADLPPDVLAGVGKLAGEVVDDDLLDKTRRAVALVLASSELLDLWIESEEDGTWRTAVIDLEQRLL
jgi:hypothetical protein